MHKKNMPSLSTITGFGTLTICALACAMPGTLHANTGDALNFIVGTSATYDDNLFRLAPGRAVPVPGQTSRSDMIYTTYAGIRVDKTYGLQRFQADLTATRYEYQTYDFLSFSAVDYRAAWLWSLTPRLTGSIFADRIEKPTNYSDFNSQNRKNIQTNETRGVLADWLVGGAWHLTGGIYQTNLKNSAAFTAVGSYVQDTAEAGIKYVSPARNSIALVHRESTGEYSNRSLGPALLDTNYTQSETELQSMWQISGHSSLNAKLAYLERSHKNYSQRDYAGAIGALNYRWNPTEKLQFTLATGRNMLSYQETTADYSSSYYVIDYITLSPAWMLTEKTTLRLQLDTSKRDYRGAVTAAALSREDTIRTAQFSIAWRPTQTINITSYLTHEQRSTNLPGQSYHDNIVGVAATVQF